MKTQEMDVKIQNRKRKAVEDYYKAWFRKSFQKGVKDARVILGKEIVVIIGTEFLTFVEQSILDDEYSKQVVAYTRKKAVEKNFSVLRKNLEVITGRKVSTYYVDFSTQDNSVCMTLLLGEEVEVNEEIETL